MASPPTLTTAETASLLAELRAPRPRHLVTDRSLRNYCLALLMLDAGLRVGEAVRLRLSDLYFACAPVTAISISPDIAKNHTERTVPVTDRLSLALTDYLPSHPSTHPLLPSDYAFPSPDSGRHITTRQLERIIRCAALASIGRPIHPHCLRHTFASRLMRTTGIRIVQELLGHKHLTSTQIYTHPNRDDLKQAINTLNKNGMPTAAAAVESFLSRRVPDQPDTSPTNRDMR